MNITTFERQVNDLYVNDKLITDEQRIAVAKVVMETGTSPMQALAELHDGGFIVTDAIGRVQHKAVSNQMWAGEYITKYARAFQPIEGGASEINGGK